MSGSDGDGSIPCFPLRSQNYGSSFLPWFQKIGDETYVASGYCRVECRSEDET
jgi:hypothetical protein